MADLTQASDTRTDAELADAAAHGVGGAFDELYRRHVTAAWRVAMSITGNREDAADVVAEAFTRVLAALPRGALTAGAPFRPYLLTATRNAAIDVLRRGGRVLPISTLAERATASPDGAPADRLEADAEATLVAAAFASLPERWREVLWLTEVEGLPPREAASRLGLTPNGVSQLAVRARAGLREHYLQAHLRAATGDCAFTVSRLAAYVGGALAARDVATVDQHLAGCATCKARLAELEEVGSTMRRVLLPLPIGLAALATARWELLVAGGHAAAGAAATATATTAAVAGTTGAASAAGGGVAAALATPLAVKALAIACAVVLALGITGAATVDPDDGTERALGAQVDSNRFSNQGGSTVAVSPGPAAVTPAAPIIEVLGPRIRRTTTPTATPVTETVTPTTPTAPPAADPPRTETPRDEPEPLLQVDVELATGGEQGVVLGVGLGDNACVGVCGEPGVGPAIALRVGGSLLPPITIRLPSSN